MGYTLVKKIYADDLVDGINLAAPDYQVFGFIAQSPAPPVDVIVAIRGTEGIFEWLQNFEFFTTPFPFVPNAGHIEEGFSDFYETFVADPDNPTRVVDVLRGLCAGTTVATLHIAGHSLGAALATCLAVDTAGNNIFASPTVYTFASPAVGDKLFAGRYDALVTESWRITNQNDIVTHLPPRWAGYIHVDAEVPINSDATTKHSIPCWHSLQTYLHVLDATRPLDPGCIP